MIRAMVMFCALVAGCMFAAAAPAAVTAGDLGLEARAGAGRAPKFKATYREHALSGGQTQLRLKVRIENVKPGSTHRVSVEGAFIGVVTAGPLGRAERDFRTITNNPGGPTQFAPIVAGDRIDVGRLTGLFDPA